MNDKQYEHMMVVLCGLAARMKQLEDKVDKLLGEDPEEEPDTDQALMLHMLQQQQQTGKVTVKTLMELMAKSRASIAKKLDDDEDDEQEDEP